MLRMLDMETSLTNNLLEFLGEPPLSGAAPNPTTLLRQGQVAQEWLLKTYLCAWLELVGGLVDCEYPIARKFRVQLRALARLSQQVDPALPPAEQVVFLESVKVHLRSVLRRMDGEPSERSLQWGIWARDVPMAIAYAFDETEFMNSLVCEELAPCCMFAGFLVSQVVTDDGVSEEVEGQMFEELPRQLVELLRRLPVAPEA